MQRRFVSSITELLAGINPTSTVGFDTETYNPAKKDGTIAQALFGKVRLIQVKVQGDEVVRLLDVHTQQIHAEWWMQLIDGLLYTPKAVVAQNGLYDLQTIQQHSGISIDLDKINLIDTMRMGKDLKMSGGNGLGQLYKFFLNIDPYELIGKAEQQKSDWSKPLTEVQIDYAALDVMYIIELAQKMQEHMSPEAYTRMQLKGKAGRYALLMQHNGLYVDQVGAMKYANKYNLQQNEALDNIRVATGVTTATDAKLLTILRSPTKTAALLRLEKSNKLVIKQYLLEHEGDVLCDGVLKGRQAISRLRTLQGWVEGDKEHRPMHCFGFFKPDTSTGRYSSSRYNMQNQPRDSKDCLSAGEDYYTVAFDFAQQELRIACAIMGERMFYSAFKKFEDVHQHTADAMGVSRQLAKSINFGLLYGMGHKALQEYLLVNADIWLPIRECQRVHQYFMQTHPDIVAHKKWAGDDRFKLNQPTYNLMGEAFVTPSYTQQINIGTQSGGSNNLHYTMAIIDKFIPQHKLRAQGSVHDSNVWGIRKDDPRAMETLQALGYAINLAWGYLLEYSASLGIAKYTDIPMPIEIGVGETWGEAQRNADDKPIISLKGDEFSDPALRAQMEEYLVKYKESL